MKNKTLDSVKRPILANSGSCLQNIESIDQSVFGPMQAEFRNKPPVKFHSQQYEQFSHINPYRIEDKNFVSA